MSKVISRQNKKANELLKGLPEFAEKKDEKGSEKSKKIKNDPDISVAELTFEDYPAEFKILRGPVLPSQMVKVGPEMRIHLSTLFDEKDAVTWKTNIPGNKETFVRVKYGEIAQFDIKDAQLNTKYFIDATLIDKKGKPRLWRHDFTFIDSYPVDESAKLDVDLFFHDSSHTDNSINAVKRLVFNRDEGGVYYPMVVVSSDKNTHVTLKWTLLGEKKEEPFDLEAGSRIIGGRIPFDMAKIEVGIYVITVDVETVDGKGKSYKLRFEVVDGDALGQLDPRVKEMVLFVTKNGVVNEHEHEKVYSFDDIGLNLLYSDNDPWDKIGLKDSLGIDAPDLVIQNRRWFLEDVWRNWGGLSESYAAAYQLIKYSERKRGVIAGIAVILEERDAVSKSSEHELITTNNRRVVKGENSLTVYHNEKEFTVELGDGKVLLIRFEKDTPLTFDGKVWKRLVDGEIIKPGLEFENKEILGVAEELAQFVMRSSEEKREGVRLVHTYAFTAANMKYKVKFVNTGEKGFNSLDRLIITRGIAPPRPFIFGNLKKMSEYDIEFLHRVNELRKYASRKSFAFAAYPDLPIFLEDGDTLDDPRSEFGGKGHVVVRGELATVTIGKGERAGEKRTFTIQNGKLHVQWNPEYEIDLSDAPDFLVVSDNQLSEFRDGKLLDVLEVGEGESIFSNATTEGIGIVILLCGALLIYFVKRLRGRPSKPKRSIKELIIEMGALLEFKRKLIVIKKDIVESHSQLFAEVVADIEKNGRNMIRGIVGNGVTQQFSSKVRSIHYPVSRGTGSDAQSLLKGWVFANHQPPSDSIKKN